MTVIINGTTGIQSPSINTSGQKMNSSIFRVNAQTLNDSTTIDTTENASVVGPLSLASGVVITVNGNLTVI